MSNNAIPESSNYFHFPVIQDDAVADPVVSSRTNQRAATASGEMDLRNGRVIVEYNPKTDFVEVSEVNPIEDKTKDKLIAFGGLSIITPSFIDDRFNSDLKLQKEVNVAIQQTFFENRLKSLSPILKSELTRSNYKNLVRTYCEEDKSNNLTSLLIKISESCDEFELLKELSIRLIGGGLIQLKQST